MTYFVFYRDDWADNGGIGLEPCASRDAALAWIEHRLQAHPEATLSQYTLIEGWARPLETYEAVTKVRMASEVRP